MHHSFVKTIDFSKSSLWEGWRGERQLLSFTLEVTARCNLNCRHCYINLPAHDSCARGKELSLAEIKSLIDQAVDLGALWCLMTGGEPLLREDFFEIYLYAKEKGLLISVFTNACPVNGRHIDLFKNYPPRDIEVTVYGVTRETYEKVTRKKGSFEAFRRGLDLLLGSGVKVRLKAMALRSNVHELPQISEFCRRHTKDYFRFDPLLHLRLDGDGTRNEEIKSERLSAEEIVAVEQQDPERQASLEKNCGSLIHDGRTPSSCDRLFHCGTGNGNFSVSYDGFFRPCSSLNHPACRYDLRKGTLKEAYKKFVPRLRDMRSRSEEFLTRCHACPIVNLCLWCPAHSHLETGRLDTPVDYFCQVAHRRADSVKAALG